MDEMTFTLHNPLTEEELDIIEDVDFDHTNSITFHTKNGKEVVFVKRKRGRWIRQSDPDSKLFGWFICSECGAFIGEEPPYCSNCGAAMKEEKNETP